MFLAGVARCSPKNVLPPYLPAEAPSGRTIILGAGKAAAEMAAVAFEHLEGEVSGCVVTRYGHGAKTKTGSVEVFEAGHPTPDQNGIAATRKIMAAVAAAGPDDRVLFFISGGGSALLACPIEGLDFEEKRAISKSLILSGAPIEDINFIRKHLSRVKGGGLSAMAAPAEQITYIISDVVGDNPADVASGPTVFSKRDPERAIRLLRHYGCVVSNALERAIRTASLAPPPSHETHILATNADALNEVSARLKDDGWRVNNLGADITGDAGAIGLRHAELATEASWEKLPTAFVSGGELTVQVQHAEGCGGPNLEYLAAFAEHLPEGAPIAAVACDSDGVDGTEDSAGAYVDGGSVGRFTAAGVSIDRLRAANQTYRLFEAAGDLIVTGPTRTNVNDIRITLVNGHA